MFFFRSGIHKMTVSIAVPIGLSFYSLSIIGYVSDVMTLKIRPERNPLRFLLYISYFPHILQGPIPRYDKLSKTLFEGAGFEYERVTRGCQLMVWGLMKKLLFADRMGCFVDAVYGTYSSCKGSEIILSIILYGFQLYADFSGCVDISLGISEIFGIELQKNFNGPYLAVSVKDFWRRWHISLSLWLRDYVYIPLGGSRKGKIRKYLNLMATFIVSGIWHGTGFNFLFWGIFHAFCQITGEITDRSGSSLRKRLGIKGGPERILRSLITFVLVDFAWHFFRSESLSDAFLMLFTAFRYPGLSSLLDGTAFLTGITAVDLWFIFPGIFLILFIDILHEKGLKVRESIGRLSLPVRWIIYLSAFFLVVIFGRYGSGYDMTDFIYQGF